MTIFVLDKEIENFGGNFPEKKWNFLKNAYAFPVQIDMTRVQSSLAGQPELRS